MLARQLLWLSLGCGPAMAQDGTLQTGRAWTVIPTFGITTELRNVSGYTADPREAGTELVTQAGPGLQIVSRSGRVRGSFDGRLLGTVYARHGSLNTLTGSLATTGQAEVVPDFAYIDASASFNQQSSSGYGLGQQTGSLGSQVGLREIGNFTLSPYVRGTVGALADYELRYTGQGTVVRKLSEENSTSQLASATLRSRPGPPLGWALQASTQRVDFNSGRRTQLDRAIGSVDYALDAGLQLFARAGRESTDVESLRKQSYATYGAGVRWTPSRRTTLALDVDKRYYGTGYRLVAEHRFRRAVVRFTSVRDTTSGVDAAGVGQPITLLQLYLLQYASVEPDAALRELRVRELLRLTNQDPTALVNVGLATAAVSLQQRSDIALSLLGARSSMTAQAFVSTSQTIDRLSPAAGGRFRQEGLLLTGAHRMTPVTSLTLSGSYYRSEDARPLGPPGTLAAIALGLTTALDTRTTASLGARFARTRTPTTPTSRETALSASANVRF